MYSVIFRSYLCVCRTHCNAEAMSQKELCEERVTAAKLEVEMKMKKLSTSPDESSLVKRRLFIRMLELGKNLCKSLIYRCRLQGVLF